MIVKVPRRPGADALAQGAADRRVLGGGSPGGQCGRADRDRLDPPGTSPATRHRLPPQHLGSVGEHVLIRLWPVTEAHMTIALAQDQATLDDPRRATM